MNVSSVCSWFADELDIVEEGEIDDGKDEEHVENPLPSASMEPIVQCSGFLRLDWLNLEVVILNDNKVPIAEPT